MKYKILIFIITYKASFRVLDLVNKIPIKYLKKHNYAIYASDDASKDNTILYLKKLKKRFKKKFNLGRLEFPLYKYRQHSKNRTKKKDIVKKYDKLLRKIKK